MQIQEVESIVDEQMEQGKTVDQIIDVLAQNKCFHTLVEIILLKKKVLNIHEIRIKLESHEYYSQWVNKKNPFTEEFIKSFKNTD